MITSPRTQTGYAGMTGLADLFRQRHAGSIRNDGDVRTINGFNVDVTGKNARSETRTTTAIQHGPGVLSFKPQAASGMMAPSTLKSMLQTQDISISREQVHAAMDPVANARRERLASLPDTVEITQRQEVPVEQVGGALSKLPANDAERVAQTRERITHMGDLSRTEQDLSNEFGVEVKLAWDPVAEEYLALKPGQDGYDRVRGARDLMSNMARDIAKGGEDPREFADLLAEYGVKV